MICKILFLGTNDELVTSIFICMPKINFIIHFYLDILHFKESFNLISRKHFGPYLNNQNSSRYGIGGEISITIIVFNLDSFQKKHMTKFSRKCKNSYFGAILSPFCLNLSKYEFFWHIGLSKFLNIPSIYHHAKIRKN